MTIYDSPIGKLTIVAHAGHVAELRVAAEDLECAAAAESETEKAAMQWLDAYFGNRPLPAMPALRPEGTDFQKRVWQEVCAIPYGRTATYGEIALRLGSSARAVGRAVGSNPVAIMIPCHRVVAAHGRLGGYAYGTKTKSALLCHEADCGKTLFCNFKENA